MSESAADRWSAGILLVWALAAFWAAHPRAVGLFSDDGIYLATARALATEGEYRLTNLPGDVAQTKYPPLWPAVLSLLWRVEAEPARVARAAQALSIVLMALSWWLFRRLASRSLGISPARSLAVVLLPVASPMLYIGACWPLSEALFSCLAAGSLLAAAARAGEPERATGAWLSGILAAAAFLTRVQGVALVAALGLARLRQNGIRALVRAALPGTLAMLGWLAWTSSRAMPGNEAGPLISYYTSYRHSLSGWQDAGAWARLGEIPSAFARSVAAFGELVSGATGGSAWLAGAVLACFASLGCRTLLREGRAEVPLWFVGSWILAAIQPDPSPRFLLPVLPIGIALAGLGLPSARPWRRFGQLFAAALGLAGLVRIGFEIASRNPAFLPNPRTLSSPASPLAEFETTAAYLRQNVSRSDGIGAASDLWFHLATGRPVLRYWIYRPRELARVGRGAAPPAVGEAHEILPELRRLGVNWLVLEPGSVDRFAEGPTALALGREIVSLPTAHAELRYLSASRGFEVYHFGEP